MTAFTSAFERHTTGLQVGISIGPCAICDYCLDAYGIEPDNYIAADDSAFSTETAKRLQIDRMQDELNSVDSGGGFSWADCDTCGSSLGGDRYDAHAFDTHDNIIHLCICVDCVMYIANGDEPVSWE